MAILPLAHNAIALLMFPAFAALVAVRAAVSDHRLKTAAAGASVSISPASELRIGFGLTKIGEYLDHKVNLALSVDTTPLTGNADMFGIMKLAQNLENGRSGKMTMRRGHHTSSGLKAMGKAPDESPLPEESTEDAAEASADIEPA